MVSVSLSDEGSTLCSQCSPTLTARKPKMSTNCDRREFIQTSGTAVSALALGTWKATADDKTKNKIRVGIIGCGSVSRLYFPNLSECPYAEIVSACDII